MQYLLGQFQQKHAKKYDDEDLDRMWKNLERVEPWALTVHRAWRPSSGSSAIECSVCERFEGIMLDKILFHVHSLPTPYMAGYPEADSMHDANKGGWSD